MPKIRDEPAKFKEELKVIVDCYNPTVADLTQLLRLAVPEETLKRMKEKVLWPDATIPISQRDLNTFRTRLLDSIKEVCPKKTDWSKINSCVQQRLEKPQDYMTRLRRCFEAHSGINNLEEAKSAIVATFVNGLLPKISESIKTVLIGWEAKSLEEVLTAAQFYFAKEERLKDAKETKLMALQIQALSGEAARNKADTRGRGRGRARGGAAQGAPRAPRAVPSAPPLDRETCFKCGGTGHWRNECPGNTKGAHWHPGPPQRDAGGGQPRAHPSAPPYHPDA